VLGDAAKAAVTECDVCGLSTTDLVHCHRNHAFCIGDFSRAVHSEISQHRQRFISNGCRLLCPLCTTGTSRRAGREGDFARQCASQLTDDTYDLYEGAITEKAVIAAQVECEKRCSTAPKPASQDPDEETIGQRTHTFTLLNTTLHHHFSTAAATIHITEQLVYPRCPTCQGLMPDFEACASLHCETCGSTICAWCFTTHPDASACHAHILSCPFNLNPGYLYPPLPHPALWWSVMHEWARKRIRDYILAQVNPKLQQRVHNMCKTMHPHLGLVAWDVQSSGDGYRHTSAGGRRSNPTPTFDANITTLIGMGLANQARAEQVLQGLGNDLSAAVELLLGYNTGPR
jgi:hypothetical protein